MTPFLSLLVLLASPEAKWERDSEEDGLLVETQKVEGSSFENLRVTGNTRASPDQFMAAWWGKIEQHAPEVVKREVFSDTENERLYWDMVSASPAGDRDYVMHLKKTRDEKTGAWTMVFKSVDDKRKPPGDMVRMSLSGSMTVSPDPKGGSRIVYVVFTDIGGAIPAVFARGAQRKSAIGLVREARKRAQTAQAGAK